MNAMNLATNGKLGHARSLSMQKSSGGEILAEMMQ